MKITKILAIYGKYVEYRRTKSMNGLSSFQGYTKCPFDSVELLIRVDKHGT
jgi:hypothetical protein